MAMLMLLASLPKKGCNEAGLLAIADLNKIAGSELEPENRRGVRNWIFGDHSPELTYPRHPIGSRN